MATSRKSSSKKSSSRKSSVSKSTDNYNMGSEYMQFNFFGVILNMFIIYYLLNLEDKSCNCIRDWRHDYIKYLAIFNIVINMLVIVGLKIKLQNIAGFIAILSIINIYAFYTYIGDLTDTKCECAVSKQKNLHDFLNILRYMMVIIPIVMIIYILFLFYMISNHYGK